MNDGLEQVSSGPHSTLARQVLPSSGGAPSPTGAEPGTRAGLRAVGPLSLPPAPTCARSASRPGPGPDFCLPLPRRLHQPHLSARLLVTSSCDTSLPSPLAGTLFPQPFKRLARFPEARPWHPHPSAQGLRDSYTVCLPLKRGPHDAPSCQRLTQPGVVKVEKGLIQ